MLLSTIWATFFGWMPVALQIAFFAFLAIAVIVMVLKILAMIWDAIPFM